MSSLQACLEFARAPDRERPASNLGTLAELYPMLRKVAFVDKLLRINRLGAVLFLDRPADVLGDAGVVDPSIRDEVDSAQALGVNLQRQD